MNDQQPLRWRERLFGLVVGVFFLWTAVLCVVNGIEYFLAVVSGLMGVALVLVMVSDR